MRVANPDLYDTIAERRGSMDDAPYLVYCANCAATFALAGKTHAHILDIIFPSEDYIIEGLQRLRNNAALTKEALSMLYEGKVSPSIVKPWGDNLYVEITPSLIAEMDNRLILEDDVREAIYEAERTGAFFIFTDGASGGVELRRCRLVRDVVTIWVQYTKTVTGSKENCYKVQDIWSHRMRFFDGE